MATFQDLEYDWLTLSQECPDSWSQSDLQLAAELGKTLLERNKELETSLKQHQNIIEDQTQEIDYLTKQTVALREVNDSRLRIYEQLEVSIHDLERTNHRLKLENSADKKQIKNLCASVGVLETRFEELQGSVDDLTSQLDTYKRKCQQQEAQISTGISMPSKHPKVHPEAVRNRKTSHDKQVQCDSSRLSGKQCSTSTLTDFCTEHVYHDQIVQLTAQLHGLNNQRIRDQRRIMELEEQLSALVQDNQTLQDHLVAIASKEDDIKSMHEKFSSLDEVRQGHMCSRCLRSADEISILDSEEEDKDSMIDALIGETRYQSSVSLNIQQDSQSQNRYRDPVEKY